MKVILITAIPNLGKIGDIIEVKNGYAKNFLIPNLKAIYFTEQNYKIFKDKKHEFEQENIKNLEIANKVKNKIMGQDVLVIENASDDGRLYGSVNSSVIAKAINDMIGEKLVSKSAIVLNKSIKEIGVYEFLLNLHAELSFSLRLVVTRSKSEAEVLIKNYNKLQNSSEKKSSNKENKADLEESKD